MRCMHLGGIFVCHSNVSAMILYFMYNASVPASVILQIIWIMKEKGMYAYLKTYELFSSLLATLLDCSYAP